MATREVEPESEGEGDDRGDDRGFFGHPRGLSVLFFSEIWERFSYYGMRAMLVLYMVYEFGYPEDPRAYGVYGAYGALVYAFPVIGGWLANQWLGYRRAIVMGGVFMALGHFAMAVPHELGFYLALALICVGNGFFKPNISSTVGRLYRPDDLRRDRGFTIFYMGINIGAFSGPLIAGMLGEHIDWHLGFSIAGVGMVLGLIRFALGQRTLGGHGEPDDPALLRAPVILGLNRFHLVIIGAALVAPLAACALYWYEIAQGFIVVVSAAVLITLIVFTVLQKGVARLRMIALIILMFFHMLFWAGFEQAGSSFNIMTKQHVDREVLGFTIGATAFQSVNALFIILLAPLFNILWKRLQARGWNPSIPMKFALGLFQLGVGFWVLAYGISQADSNATIALWFMVLCYFFHTTGELCLSPIGLSAVTKLAPLRWVGFCMGAWFLTMANAHVVAAAIAKLTAGGGAAEGEVAREVARAEALVRYATVFEHVFYTAMVAGVILMALTPLIKRLMRGVE
jgi:proton-dependent oligopeptide transporter, POT family